jgi:sec-independent protein translocase protein TatA
MGFVNVGPLELLVIGVIALLVLGPKRLPEAARSVGRGMREMKEALQGSDDEDDYQKDPDSIASSSSSSGRE